MYTRLIGRLAVTSLTLLLWSVGCNQAPNSNGNGNQPTDGNGDGTTIGSEVVELSSAQEKAVSTALESLAALSQAVNTAQSGTQGANSSSQALPDLPLQIQFGSCPVVTLSAVDLSLLAFTITVDFGDACAPAIPAGALCSGSATGEIDTSGPSIELTFDSVTCGAGTLDGSADLTYLVAEAVVTLEGAWALTVIREGEGGSNTNVIEGGGTCTYDGALALVNIEEFAATISDGTTEWDLSADHVLIELSNSDVIVPFGGSVTLTQEEGDTIVALFTEQSPVTGEVQVSINEGPTFTVNVFELE